MATQKGCDNASLTPNAIKTEELSSDKKEVNGLSIKESETGEFASNIQVRAVDDCNSQLLCELSSCYDEILQTISKLTSEKDFASQIFQNNLDNLVYLKRRICEASDPRIWTKKYLLHPTIQQLMLTIVDSRSDIPRNVKSTLQEVISQRDISLVSSEEFPELERVSSWLYEPRKFTKQIEVKKIACFPSFIKFLNSLAEEEIADKKLSASALANIVSEGIYYLRFKYKDTYNDILIMILVQPFMIDNFNDVISLKNISLSDLQFMKLSFSEQKENFESYQKKGSLVLQSYLFLLAIASNTHKVEQSKIFIKQIYQMLHDIQIPIEKEIQELLIKYFKELSLEDMKCKLYDFLLKPCQGRLKISLKHRAEVVSKQEETECQVNKTIEQIGDEFNKLSYYEDDFCLLNENPEAHSLLEKLELCVHYPRKLKLREALCIRPESLELSLNVKFISDFRQLPNLIIHKMLSYDSFCRTELMSLMQIETKQTSESDDSECDEFVESDEEDETKSQQEDSSFGVHPVDCLLAILTCSDDFLCQDLLSRLAKCQLAIPFIFPEPFSKKLRIPLWAMQSIIKEWKSTGKNNEIMEHTCSIVQYPMPIISFIRIGLSQGNSPSKSKILNEVISDAHHDYFFHRDCRGGQYKTILGRGLVDICWYLPFGNPADIFPDAVTFLNLHGDARDYPQQFKFLSKISNMCVIILTESEMAIDGESMEYLHEFYSTPGGIVVLNITEKQPKEFKKAFPKSHVINLVSKSTTKTAAEIKDAIRARIKMKIEKMQNCNSIESMCSLIEGPMEIDEDCQEYKIGLDHAMKLKEMITGASDSELTIKDTVIPLQGNNLWKAWATKDKELHRQTNIGSESIHQYTAKIEHEKSNLRSKQLEQVKCLSPAMKYFIKSLVELKRVNTSSLRNYFLQILKLEMNSVSREVISEKQSEYQATRKKLSKLQAESSSQKTEIKEEIAKLQERLKVVQEDIINSSFGLEHLLRELGQVYEAALEGKKKSNPDLDYYISNLPKAAAELLVDGYPLELMDGDAAHVPLGWVVAVIKEAVKLLDDPRVFVLSVLGLQSTGKSTMLNTAFGLQFNVSAGRCTRGAFMQLLSLDEDLRTRTKCSYVLVVDTEGLRAPELDPEKTQKHDNELATFVIGLANMTLINIYGEVPGDMDDILQTSVHAFLRMSQVKYHPSCQFVHQNAGVNIKGEVGRAKFTQKLNKFTVDAAREEHCEGRFETFNDVIKFNDQTDVHYFPGLWKGDPPMAPVNQGYSQTAQNLKYQLVQIISERAGTGMSSSTENSIGDLSLSSFHIKIKDLWETLLKEKFVFSFKNTLEITAYNSLETAYSKWDWTLQSAMLEWEQKAENEISTEAVHSVTEKVQQKLEELQRYVSQELCPPLKLEMEKFFNGKQSEILCQWKKRFEIRLECSAKDYRIHAEEHCNNLLRSKQAISEFEAAQQKNIKFIYKKVQEHIEIVKKEEEKLQESLEKRELEPDQLKKLLARNLFTSESLQNFEEQQILSEDKVKMITEFKLKDDGQLTESSLKNVLENGILTLSEIKKILKKSQLTEEELHVKFNDIWMQLMMALPKFKSTTHMSVNYEVERVLIKFVDGKGYHGQLIAKLQNQGLNQWEGDLQFHPERNIHYAIKGTFIKETWNRVRVVLGAEDAYEGEALEITQAVFDEACKDIEEVVKKDTDFKAAFASKLLRLVDQKITDLSKSKTCKITLTPDYRLDMYIIVCRYAISKFEKMAKSFEERNDPQLHLEKHVKMPLFTKFKNQYQQTIAEEAIAETICAFLEEPIKVQVEKLLPAKIVIAMKANEYHFTNKSALKLKILKDLKRENSFEKYMLYIEKIETCLNKKITEYTEIYCETVPPESTDDKTRLQITAKDEVNRLIQVVMKVVSEINQIDARKWINCLCGNEKLRSDLGVIIKEEDLLIGFNSIHDLNLDSFKNSISEGLEQLRIKYCVLYENIKYKSDILNWNDKSVCELRQKLIGCTEQCPFCKEQCDLLKHDEKVDHRTELHRVSCIAGWRSVWSNEMETDVCTTLVGSDCRFAKPDGGYHPYKEYKQVHTRWSIPRDTISKNSSYWKKFVWEYRHKLAQHYKAKDSSIPECWSEITEEKIEEDLESAYYIKIST